MLSDRCNTLNAKKALNAYLMICQHQPEAAEALHTLALGVASPMNSGAEYLKYSRMDIKNHINANYYQKM